MNLSATPFDFDKEVVRRGTACYKWDEPERDDIIPMWVADMDFTAAPCILAALRRRLDHGVFGYEKVPPAFYDSLTNWFATRHHWQIDPSSVLYTTGVVPALSAIIKALAQPRDRVLVLTPVYNCFFSSIRNNGCEVEECPLVVGDNGLYAIDFADMERRAARPDVTVMLMCNPHNPGGRVWTPEELAKVADVCRRHDVALVSDEIHCELVLRPGLHYTPMAVVAPGEVISCVSPSKSFNTAGLHVSAIVCPDTALRGRIDRALNINEVCDVNPFGVEAFIAAYREGAPWIDALCRYLWDNYLTLLHHFEAALPALPVMPLEGSYLAWVDIRSTGLSSDTVTARLLEQARVMVNSGTMYGAAGEGYIRLNLATRRTLIAEALQRITPVLQEMGG